MSFRFKALLVASSLLVLLGLGSSIIIPTSAQRGANKDRRASLAPMDTTAQTLPFSQDWSNTGLITTDNTWTNVPGIMGYRGDDLTTGIGTDPQTLLADGSTTPVNVIANNTNPSGYASGAVVEAEITNPTIAMQGSGTADAPHIVIHLNTTGKQNIRVRYNVRDLDSSSDNTNQQVATHYRVGGTGAYTNLPSGYVADATTGPTIATAVTAVDVTLPSDANDKPLVAVRIMTTNAPVNDEIIGIDDIQITGDNLVSTVPVSISSVGAVPGQVITVPVTIGDVTGKAVSAYDFVMTYDSTKLTPASPVFDITGTLSANTVGPGCTPNCTMQITPSTGVAGKVNISGFSIGNLTGSGTLIKMRFTANPAAVGTAALGWQSFVLNEGDPASSATGGSVIFGRQIADFNGDGRTDFSVIRDSSGLLNWFNATNPTSGNPTISGAQWGLAQIDIPTPADFDGDGKSDIAIWREAPAEQAAYYIVRSSDSTFQFELFGATGDDPSVTGDYDGDGKADPAVFRCPTAGGQCFFYFRGSLNNTAKNITYVPWGAGIRGNGIFPVAGDFDGDAKMDFCVRVNDAGNGLYYILRSSNLGFEAVRWGLTTDLIIPGGDFDGDGRTDFAVARPGSNFSVYILERDGGGTGASPYIWGVAGDRFVTGDYDGDSLSDIAVWRPSDGVFYVLRSSNGSAFGFQWGANGDTPTASWVLPRGQ